MYVKKFTSICQSLEDAHKRKLVPFFLLFLAFVHLQYISYCRMVFLLFPHVCIVMPSPVEGSIKRCLSPSFCSSSVRLSVPPGPATGVELCGLRIRPRTDVDPPRSAVCISSCRAITCLLSNFIH